ncbi:MAG: hypothetical protein VX956_09180 [Gemmatimonadota bacterium]|nr:hypothetical protein [Gemmatimonadota bacterium]
MIVALLSDPYPRTVVGHAARSDEDVVYDPVLASDALEWGSPRLVIHSGVRAFTFDGPRSDLPVLALDRALMRSWEVDRLGLEVPAPRLDYLTGPSSQRYGPAGVRRVLGGPDVG